MRFFKSKAAPRPVEKKPSLTERLSAFEHATGTGTPLGEALRQSGLTTRLYLRALVDADPDLRAELESAHDKKMQPPDRS